MCTLQQTLPTINGGLFGTSDITRPEAISSLLVAVLFSCCLSPSVDVALLLCCSVCFYQFSWKTSSTVKTGRLISTEQLTQHTPFSKHLSYSLQHTFQHTTYSFTAYSIQHTAYIMPSNQKKIRDAMRQMKRHGETEQFKAKLEEAQKAQGDVVIREKEKKHRYALRPTPYALLRHTDIPTYRHRA
jgi:hypothetical protein